MLTEVVTNDCDQLTESLKHTQQVYRQLQPGPFAGGFRMRALPGLTVVEHRISHRTLQRGVIPASATIVFVPTDASASIFVDGHAYDKPSVMIATGLSLPLVMPNGFRSLAYEMDNAALRRTAEAMGTSLPFRLDRLTDRQVRGLR